MTGKLTRRHLLRATAATAPLVMGGCFVRTESRTTDQRLVTAVVSGTAHTDGAGVKLNKLMGSRKLPMLDPFLMLDEFHSANRADFIKGFPSHPHRGFETVSIMLDGAITHKDSVGNAGTITGGGLQWMTAGRGIVHSEMPDASPASGELWGYQLWINLPARLKMTRPRYQDLDASSFRTEDLDDAQARVLAGKVGNTTGAVDGIATDPTLLDVKLERGARFRHKIPRSHNAFAYVVSGKTRVGPRYQPVSAGELAVFGVGDAVSFEASSDSRLLVFAAAPIGEPVARRGPFVMNTEAELQQAFADYRSGRLTGG